MEPARIEQLKEAIQNQGTLLGQHENMLRGVAGSLDELTRQVLLINNQLSDLSLSAAATPVSSSPRNPVSLSHASDVGKEPYVSPPEPFSGDFGSCGRFLFNCHLVFKMQPLSYASDEAKIAYTINLLRGKAAKWVTALWEGGSDILSSFDLFSSNLRRVFDHPVQGQVAAKRLLALTQGSQSAANYSVDFQILANECGWDEKALKAVFIHGLSDDLKDELATRDEPQNLHDLYTLCIKLDSRMRERNREKMSRARRMAPSPVLVGSSPPLVPALPPPPTPAPSPVLDEPMQLGKTRLSQEERRRRLEQHLCLYCGEGSHTLSKCPNQPKDWTHP